ncbi:hypothetical protein HPP92_001966 [Vanilla planifolia]|uniref:Dihydrolipoamide acetyltransferase component of pyruvate dehydrogenase complex n=1 Tax=Vanilla planifolia TaxID=51239 RepID=A0A835VIH6_VANPL|nr:hypothetical protein HPP92_001966 [Vanilla planifolia]
MIFVKPSPNMLGVFFCNWRYSSDCVCHNNFLYKKCCKRNVLMAKYPQEHLTHFLPCSFHGKWPNGQRSVRNTASLLLVSIALFAHLMAATIRAFASCGPSLNLPFLVLKGPLQLLLHRWRLLLRQLPCFPLSEKTFNTIPFSQVSMHLLPALSDWILWVICHHGTGADHRFGTEVRWRRQEKALRSVTPQMFVEEVMNFSFEREFGDHVEEFQPICEVQSDKATMEITSKDGRVMKEDILRSTSKGICKELPSVLAVHAERSDHFKKENQNMLHLHWEKLRDKILPLSAPYGDQINFSKENTDQDVKHTFLPFLVKSLSIVLNKHPLMNSSFSEDSHAITLKGCHNIGVAMATPYGLVVPNIKNVQSKSMLRFLTTYG